MIRSISILAVAGFFALAAHPAAADALHGAATQETHAASPHGTASVVAGELEISGGWARAMLPSQPAGAGYVTITNNGTEADRLLSIISPAAGKVELHTMEITGDVMVMRPVEGGLDVKPGETAKLEPGGMHLMFMDVAENFSEGDVVRITLTFEKAGQVEVDLPVMRAGPDHGSHAH
jgi:copper(I)-binding protein